MTISNNNKKIDGKISAFLFSSTLIVHFFLIVYVSNSNAIIFFVKLQEIISKNYYDVGFEWRGIGAYVVTVALVSSFTVNGVRRALEGGVLGWPRYNAHDENSCIRALTLLIGYGVMMYFSVGFFGEKYSSKQIDLNNILLISISTYIVGMLIDILDDLISGIYCTYFRGKL
ncbi:hypothetical protein [Aeromonas veronii]|uniref:hypothetical protein n=1 Tax=Aeromonas veronii TaxID=654 RepID=UPI003B9E8BD0